MCPLFYGKTIWTFWPTQYIKDSGYLKGRVGRKDW